MRRITLNISGMSLVEAMIVILIFSLVGGALTMLLTTGQRNWNVESLQVELSQEARKGMLWMLRELPEGGVTTITNVPADGNWYNTITYRKAVGTNSGAVVWDGSTTQYLLGTNPNRLIHRRAGVDQVIASDITQLQIRRQNASPRLIEVILTAQRPFPGGAPYSVDMPFQVKLRN